MINLFKKYLFGLVVTAYVISVAGVPVYFHYCGGELEKVNYVLKSNSCCGEEENDEAEDNSCCTDENVVVKNATDFVINKVKNYDAVKTINDVAYISLPFLNISFTDNNVPVDLADFWPPPKLQNSLVISTSVIRV